MNHCIILVSVRQKKRYISLLYLIPCLTKDETIDVALGADTLWRYDSTSLTADNVIGVNSLAVFVVVLKEAEMCAHKFPFYWSQLASQRWEIL